MISKELEKKVDETVASTIVSESIDPPVAEEEQPLGLQEQLEQPVDLEELQAIPVPDQPVAEEEPVQVAGLGKILGIGVDLSKAQAKVQPALPNIPVIQTPDGILVRAASQEDIDAFQAATGGTYTKGINFPVIAENVGEFDLAAHMAKVKAANKELFEAQRRGTLNFDVLMELASAQGTDVIIQKWLNRVPGSGDTAEDVLAGLLAYQGASMESLNLAQQISKMAPGPEKDAALEQWSKVAQIEFVLAANVSGAGTEAGRTLYALSQAQKQLGLGDIKARAEQLGNIFNAETTQELKFAHDLYMGLPDPRSRAMFAKQGFFAKSMDMIIEVWINSILSSPVTHAVNIAGNSMFYLTRTAENLVASGIGTVRSGITGNKNRVYAREAFIQGQAILDAWGDAMRVAREAFVTEQPALSGTSKIDVRNQRSIGTTGDLTKLAAEGPVQAAVNILGVAVRLPGRFLIAEDEFFKAIGYRAAFRQQAYVKGAHLYDTLVEGGMDAVEAQKRAAEEVANILNNPHEYQELSMSAKRASEEMTFQTDLEGTMSAAQGLMSHPIAKLFVPFFKTPTNVVNEVLKRTPIALAYPSVRSAIKAGGREADIATSKIALGSMTTAVFANYAMGLGAPEAQDVIIVGAGPSDYAKRQAMERQGIYPYTINFRIKEGPDAGKYKSYTYSRFDPISGVLSMGADYANYAMYEDNPENLENLAMHIGMSTFNYAAQMPFLQGVAELATIFRSSDPTAQFEAAMQLAAQKGTEAALSVIPSTGSFFAGVARLEDPVARSVMPPADGDIIGGLSLSDDPAASGPMVRGFYSALQKMKSRNPFFNQDLPPRLNLWGEQMTISEGSGWEMISPVKVRTAEFSIIDEELVKLGGGVRMPKGDIKGVRLNAEQYNRLIILMNDGDFLSSDEDEVIMRGEPGFNDANTMKRTLVKMISGLGEDGEEYLTLGKTERLELINQIIEEYRVAARDQLQAEDTKLRFKIKKADEVK